ncbi:ArsR/SmtB family transcription factor [Gemmobacter caeruleus]|uniref:ArsR/SmtB family transcription factor n=1 Tax=Gemmobacter caeruleus TaxID=2595004 RepID=UPI0011EC06AF|nr:winged helix-turn-helix domain-containing protein [Gemmobacter caeruleus]
MKDGPDIALTAALIGDPARANILSALMSGKALTARELSDEAGITAQTASSHLRKLLEGGLIAATAQGRHRYFTLSGAEAARLIEALMGFAAARGQLRHRTGPRDPALRAARLCYNHLAGEAGVQLYESLIARGHLMLAPDGPALTGAGTAFLHTMGIAPEGLRRKPLCRACLDWSERRSHLAGPVGQALLTRMQEMGWITRIGDSRALRFTPTGRAAFDHAFPPPG